MDELFINAEIAPDVDVDRRVISGLVVPFGVKGQANGGPITVKPGTVSWHSDLSRVKLLRDHDTTDPVGYAQDISEEPDGIHASFKVPDGPTGDRALAEASNKTRDGLSVGIYDIQGYDARTGAFTSAKLRETSLTALPAFEDAMVQKVSAQLSEEVMTDTTTAETESANDLAVLTASMSDLTGAIKELVSKNYENNGHQVKASVLGPNAVTENREDLTLAKLSAMAAKAAQDNTSDEGKREFANILKASLTDVISTDMPGAFRPVYIQELLSGAPYSRRFIDNATTSKPLPAGKSFTFAKFTTKPVVGDYSGDKAAVPSAGVAMTDVTVNVNRIAGAWDVDRLYWDAPGGATYIQSFLEAATESYLVQTNGKAITAALAGATVLDSDAGTGGVQAYSTLLAGIQAGVAKLASVGETVDYVAISGDQVTSLMAITTANAPAYFGGAFSLTNGGNGNFGGLNVFVDPGLPAKTFVVGAKSAVWFYENQPNLIQVQAVNVANGGIDLGVFGYWAAVVANPAAIAKGTVS